MEARCGTVRPGQAAHRSWGSAGPPSPPVQPGEGTQLLSVWLWLELLGAEPALCANSPCQGDALLTQPAAGQGSRGRAPKKSKAF